jgi:hypothetical protein
MVSSLLHTPSDAKPPYRKSRFDDLDRVSICHNVEKQTLSGLPQIVESSHSLISLEDNSGALLKTN